MIYMRILMVTTLAVSISGPSIGQNITGDKATQEALLRGTPVKLVRTGGGPLEQPAVTDENLSEFIPSRVFQAADHQRQHNVTDAGGAGADEGIQLERPHCAQGGGDVTMGKRRTSARTASTAV